MPEEITIFGAFKSGQKLDEYTLVGELGSGGQGIVIHATGEDGLQVAIKGLRSNSPESVRYFQREIDIQSSINHPSVAKVYKLGIKFKELNCAALEFISGESLLDYMDKRHMSIQDRCMLFSTICDTVYDLHTQGIVHCDLKPSNFLVDATGTAKLIDFGSAFRVGREDDGGNGGVNYGSQGFKSPEQAWKRPLEHTTDIYSLGAILYQVLCGFPPPTIDENAEDDLETTCPKPPSERMWDSERIYKNGDLYPINVSETAGLRQIDPDDMHKYIKSRFDTLVFKALNPNPDQRFASASELAEAVRSSI